MGGIMAFRYITAKLLRREQRQAQTPVKKGMALLDQYEPGWRNAIKVEYLDVATTDRCVLGQVYGSFSIGLQTLSNKTGVSVDSVAHGFAIDAVTSADPYKVLTDDWKKAIRKPVAV